MKITFEITPERVRLLANQGTRKRDLSNAQAEAFLDIFSGDLLEQLQRVFASFVNDHFGVK